MNWDMYATEAFEKEYTYSGDDLGAVWSREKTTFKLWAPTAETAAVNLYRGGTKGVADRLEQLPMKRTEHGVWVAEKQGDLNGTYYTYEVKVEQEIREACDPYARTTGVNGDRAMVLNLASTDPEGWEKDKNPHAGEEVTDAVIYELHVRDRGMAPM